MVEVFYTNYNRNEVPIFLHNMRLLTYTVSTPCNYVPCTVSQCSEITNILQIKFWVCSNGMDRENALLSDFIALCNVFSTSNRWWCTKIRKRLIEAWIISILSLSPHLQIKSFSSTWLFWLIGRVLFASFEDCFFYLSIAFCVWSLQVFH